MNFHIIYHGAYDFGVVREAQAIASKAILLGPGNEGFCAMGTQYPHIKNWTVEFIERALA